jgi:hypothetical protein
MAFARLVEGGSGEDPSKSYRPHLLSMLEETERKAQKTSKRAAQDADLSECCYTCTLPFHLPSPPNSLTIPSALTV